MSSDPDRQLPWPAEAAVAELLLDVTEAAMPHMCQCSGRRRMDGSTTFLGNDRDIALLTLEVCRDCHKIGGYRVIGVPSKLAMASRRRVKSDL